MARDVNYDLYKKNKSSSLKELRHKAEYLALNLFKGFASLWSIKANQAIGRKFGQLAMRFATKDKGIAEYQIDFSFPEWTPEQKKQLLRNIFRHTGATFFETLAIAKFKADREKYVKLENTDIIRDALAEGNGIVLMGAHVGNWELFGIVFEMLGINGIAVESPIGNSKLQNSLLESRYSPNLKMVDRGDKSSAREILTCFRNNQVFLFMMDQDTKVKSVFVDFFGKKAATAVGASTFARKFNAPVISAFGARQKDGTHLYRFELLSSQPYSGGEQEAKELTQKYNLALENHIREYPDQWVWFHRRWKNQPDQDESNP